MNRIILIGNGFDLAHGLKTSYNHFIDNYWQTAIKNIRTRNKSDNTIESRLRNMYEPEKEFYSENEDILFSLSHGTREDFHKPDIFRKHTLFENKFLKIISENSSLKNWVDIEEEYFQQIKDMMQNQSKYYSDKTITNLNEDFKRVKNKLTTYLNDINESLDDYKFDFPYRNILEKIYSKPEQINKILFLNFNYTSTHKFYSKEYKSIFNEDKTRDTVSIQIHGSLRDINSNPIIFGYADEQDDTHKEIEKRGGEYLDNIKTFNYLKTSNYTQLMEFIKNEDYEIFIMGHSCGFSDKTLLQRLFEDSSCISIKPFYYIDDKGHNNYDDITKNIYRMFSNKRLMQEKVANLTACEPLF